MDILDKEKCPKCGVPSWWAYSEDSWIDFKLDHQNCHACAHKETEEAKVKKPKPGSTTFVRAVPFEGGELPTRQDFFERLQLKHEEEKKQQ